MVRYLIIGDGRLARHFRYYFTSLNLIFHTWSRQPTQPEQSLADLKLKASTADRVLLAISDQALGPFLDAHTFLNDKIVIHFSGVQNLERAYGAHPLFTFANDLYELESYKKIPFVLDSELMKFSDLLPGLPNPHYYLAPHKKSLYHALCVMSGNFTTLLWQNAIDRFHKDFDLPQDVLTPYLEQIMKNLVTAPNQALTGPMVRGDISTLLRHLDALANQPEQHLYYAFLNFYLAKSNLAGRSGHELRSI